MSDAWRNEFLIQWHLTERCNLSCRHCYQEGRTRTELPLDEIAGILRAFTATFNAWKEEYGMVFQPRLQVTGGEPLIRRDLFDLLDFASESGFTLSLLTNGALVDDSTADAIAAREIDLVQISLEGGSKTHDAVRGAGAFEKATSAARRLSERGQFVSFNMTLSRLNAGEVDSLIEAGNGTGASRISFSRLVPSGSGLELADAILMPRELKEVYEELNQRNEPAIEVVCRDPLMGLFSARDGRPASAKEEMPVGGCSAGLAAITVLPDGTAMACRRLGLVIGNLLETPFRELWVESPELWSLRSRENYTGRCGSCARWAVCRGCRAVANAVSAGAGKPDVFADDPQCWLMRAD
ncbi:MAG: radical SAM protein [Actinobacteria bacterium]|nr:radical SAM protein [Actinomycetota bacterium]